MIDAEERKVQGALASIVLFWAITSLVMFWFMLEGSSYMAGIGLAVQAVGIVTLLGLATPRFQAFPLVALISLSRSDFLWFS